MSFDTIYFGYGAGICVCSYIAGVIVGTVIKAIKGMV